MTDAPQPGDRDPAAEWPPDWPDPPGTPGSSGSPGSTSPAGPTPSSATPEGGTYQSTQARRGLAAAELRDILGEMRAAGIVAAALAALGAPLGLLWWLVAPRAQFVMTASGPDLVDYQTEAFMAGDGWFAVIGFLTGVAAAVGAWVLFRRHRGPIVLAGLALGSLLGAWIAWRVGRQVGREEFRELLRHAEVGWRFPAPIDLRTAVVDLTQGHLQVGVLGVQALTVAVVYTLLAGWSRYPSLRRPRKSAVSSG